MCTPHFLAQLPVSPQKYAVQSQRRRGYFWQPKNFTPHPHKPCKLIPLLTQSSGSRDVPDHETRSYTPSSRHKGYQLLDFRTIAPWESLRSGPRPKPGVAFATSTRSRPISSHHGTSSCTRRPRPPRISQVSGGTTASSAPSGSRPSPAWCCTARASLTREGSSSCVRVRIPTRRRLPLWATG